MQETKIHFQTFSSDRLIEIVKNAKQFGYDENIRSLALQVLKERGISEEDLQLTGNLTNYKFDYAQELYKAYNTNSQIAFLAYIGALLLESITVFHLFGINQPGIIFSIVYWAILLVYIVTWVKSFFNHINFYKSIGKELGTGDQIIFLVLGMPLYVFMYFFYKSRMKEEMQMVR